MKDALDELLDRYAPDAGAMWLASETPDIVPEHPFSPKFRRRMERLIRRQRRSPAVTAASTAHPFSQVWEQPVNWQPSR